MIADLLFMIFSSIYILFLWDKYHSPEIYITPDTFAFHGSLYIAGLYITLAVINKSQRRTRAVY